MSEMTPEESRRQLSACVELIGNYFQQNISENITRYIFGGNRVSRYVKQITSYASYFNNIFSLAFIFARGCLRVDNDSEKPVNLSAEKQSSLRIINSLKKAYVQYPVTHELIQFVLSDIQFEMQQKGSKLIPVFGRMCDFHNLAEPLSKYYKIISQWRAAPSRFSMDGGVLASMFLDLVQNMTFLRVYDLVQDEMGNFAFINKSPLILNKKDEAYRYIPAFRLIYFNTDMYLDMYSLYSVEKQEGDGAKRLGLRYVTGDGFKSLSFVVANGESTSADDPESFISADPDDYYYEIFGEDWSYRDEEQGAKKNDNFIDHVHAINYKYIKNLALAISDTISFNAGSKRALYDAYHVRHRDVFREIDDKLAFTSDIERIKLDWDGIVVMLLIESSPTSVLETLFRAVPQTFIDISHNLCRRLDNSEIPIYGKDDDELLTMADDVIKTKLIVGEAGGFGKIPGNQSDERLLARAKALLVVSSLSAAHEEETTERAICAGNIYDNISLLKRMRYDATASQRCKYVCIILGETFRHLLSFYRGLLAYGEIKACFDAESCNRCFSESQIASFQKQMQTAFLTAAKNEAETIREYNSFEHIGMLSLLGRFIELCEVCSSSIGSATAVGRNLYSALGKHDLLNVSEFKAYTRAFTDKNTDITEDNVDEWIGFALEILRYLRRGSFSDGRNSPFNAVYPFTATYNKGNENYDGYKTVTFTLNIDVDGDDKVDHKEYINVLSEFSYSLTNVFYCLPNLLRSNKRWWIDPVLISFKDFNDIFVE